MSQNALLDPADEALLDAWYLEHLRCMSSVPGIFSGQRFKTSTPGFPPSLALYSVTSERAFDNPCYRSFRGMGALASRVDERQHHVNLFDGLEAAPVVGDDDVLLLADRASPRDALEGMSFVWLKCVGRDFSTPYRAIAVVAARRLPRLGVDVGAYRPVTVRFGGLP